MKILIFTVMFLSFDLQASCTSWSDVDKKDWEYDDLLEDMSQEIEYEGRTTAMTQVFNNGSQCHGWTDTVGTGFARPVEYYPMPFRSADRIVNCSEENGIQRIDNICPDRYFDDSRQFAHLAYDSNNEVTSVFNINTDGRAESRKFWTMNVVDMDGNNLDKGMKCMQQHNFRCYYYDREFCTGLLAYKNKVQKNNLSPRDRSEIEAVYQSKSAAHQEMLGQVLAEFETFKAGRTELNNFTFPEDQTRFPPKPLFGEDNGIRDTLRNVREDVANCERLERDGSFTVVPSSVNETGVGAGSSGIQNE